METIFAAILRIPFSVIAPIILVLCAIGAYTVNNNAFDVVMMMVFGVAGYLMKKCNYPLAPMVLAMVIGDIPPLSCALTVRHARSSASFLDTPRFS